MRSALLVPAVILVVAGCATLADEVLTRQYGPARTGRYDQPALASAGVPSYRRDIKPILDQRCVVCHGCYDAPCQLKLGSWEGLARGLSKASVYGDLRLHDAPLTRLGLDAQRASQWRGLGFEPVLDERSPGPVHPPEASLLWRSLQLKAEHPLPAGEAVLPEKDFDFSLSRSNACPSLGEYPLFAQAHPQAGMPYGLPAIEPAAQAAIARWLQAGAPDEPPAPLPATLDAQVQRWEAFLNGDSLRQRLVGRYLYEHLFLGHLVFEGDATQQVFRLVRSATPPGQPLRLIATRRPFDDPGVARVWYRLRRDDETLLAKTHMPYRLGEARLARWRQWFVDTPFSVGRLPGYAPQEASNPFRSFAAIPLASRYRFLLDDAGYYVMNFIKGPVCRGPVALDVIRDRFWVFFVDPEAAADDDLQLVAQRAAQVLRMPAAEGPNARLAGWRAIAASEDALQQAKTQAMAERYGGARRINLDFVWNGDGRNPHAALTVFRHFDSATVEQGLVGAPPTTAWVIGYPLLERIYYLLVAGFDVYGNTAHQLQTRLAMDFLRMEGEANFLSLLPRAAREPLRDAWYEGAPDEAKRRVIGGAYRFDAESGIAFPPGDAAAQQRHLYGLLQQRLAPVLNRRHELTPRSEPDAAIRAGLAALGALRGPALRWWPEAVVLHITPPDRAATPDGRWVSLLRDTAHRNVSTLFLEPLMLKPEDDALTAVPGFIGAYPNALLQLSASELPALAQAIAGLRSEADYRALADRWAVRRTAPGFWAAHDAMQAAYRRWAPEEAGLLDLSRFENR